MLDGVVAGGFDGIEDGQAAATEKIEVHAQSGVDLIQKREAAGEKLARAHDEIAQERGVARVEAARFEIGGGEAARAEGFERYVDATLVEVARDVLPKIGE